MRQMNFWMTICFIAAGLYLFPVHAEESATPPPQEEKPDEPYRIGAGDVLEIFTWKEPDFTRDVLVRNDGMITFPLINDIQAEGYTPLELKDMIQKKLALFIKEPSVTVFVKNPSSKTYYILGEVEKTGRYGLLRKLTVLQAFALAGGFTEWASKKEILLLRKNENDQDEIIRINYKDIIKGKDLSQNIYIQSNDTIIVP